MVKLAKIGRDPFGKWSTIASHKDLGRWGIKNIYFFAQALAEKISGD